MTEQHRYTPEQFITDTETEIQVREIESLILSTDPRILETAAYVVSHLPRFSVVDGELAGPSLSDQIRQRIIDTSPR